MTGFGFGPTRFAAFATRRPRRVLAVWGVLVLLSLGLVGGLLGSGLTSEETLTNNPDSYVAKHLIDSRLPSQRKVDEVIVVRSEGALVSDPAFVRHVRTLIARIRASHSVSSIHSYQDARAPRGLVSADRHATLVSVLLAGKKADKHERIADLIPVVEGANGAGFKVTITGLYTRGHDFTKVSKTDLSKGELQFGLPGAIVVLLLVFGTLTGAMIPMLMAIVSIVVALGITALAGQVFTLNLFITNMVVAMGLALGVDYSLFIVSRLREERRRGRDTRAAIMVMANTATRAVVFSGTAFTLAMVGMLLVPDTVLRSLGFGAVVVGLVSIAVAVTFHPALLMLLGDRVDRLRIPWIGRRIAASAGAEGPLWRRAILGVMRRPAISLIATTLLLLTLASPVLGLRIGAAGGAALPNGTVAKQGLRALERDFAAGASDPVNIVVDTSADPRAGEGLQRLRAQLARDSDFAAGSMTVQPGRQLAVASLPLTIEPATKQASAAIDRLRKDYVPRAFGANAGAVVVGGHPAESRDSFAVYGGWLPKVIAFVLLLTVVVLTLAFRSIVIPLTAIAVNLLSVGAAYGILVLVFQNGVATDALGFTKVDRIDAWIPLFLFSVLFGLSMDYQVFLLSRIRERWRQTGDTPGAIVHGVASTARLITGAAAIIIVVFSGFASGQLVPFQEMGFGIAVALALDATLVRLVLIPAAMRMLDERNWYLPRWLEWLPKLQVEGALDEPPRDDTPKMPPAPPVSPATAV